MRRPIFIIYGVLIGANLGAWIGALAVFRHRPALLEMALAAWLFGMRHALDADHIAAIDNVTRKLVQERKRPLLPGLYFALGHSTVVILASILLVATAGTIRSRFPAWRDAGSLVGTGVSVFFLWAIALVNLVSLWGACRAFLRARRGTAGAAETPDAVPGGGIATRLARPLFSLVRKSWHMYPLGFLFGLGFDTATEIGLLGIAAAGVATGMSPAAVLVFPALFTAGMSLVDTTDGVVMRGAYGWALRDPARKLGYNMAVTAASVVAGVGVGGIEILGLAGSRLSLSGRFWQGIDSLNAHFWTLGCAIAGLFVAGWGASVLAQRAGNAKPASCQI